MLSIFFAKNNFLTIQPKSKTQTKQTKTQSPKINQYTVKPGEDLWYIAEKTYGSGFNAWDIALYNKITDPNLILPGQTLILPSLTPKLTTKGEIVVAETENARASVNQYRVKAGDYLWKIALEIYGDGYAWVKIAQANQLTNPNFIDAGKILIIPK